jgi:hypothetical protein
MVRRWSYLEYSVNSTRVKATYSKRTFKNTVRFKKFSDKATKVLRKKFNSRKVFNSTYHLMIYAFRWVKYYRVIAFKEKLTQLNNFFLQKLFPVNDINRQWSNSVIASLRTGINFKTLYVNSNTCTQFLIFNTNLGYSYTSNLEGMYPKQNQVEVMLKFSKSLRRLLTILQLSNIFSK